MKDTLTFPHILPNNGHILPQGTLFSWDPDQERKNRCSSSILCARLCGAFVLTWHIVCLPTSEVPVPPIGLSRQFLNAWPSPNPWWNVFSTFASEESATKSFRAEFQCRPIRHHKHDFITAQLCLGSWNSPGKSFLMEENNSIYSVSQKTFMVCPVYVRDHFPLGKNTPIWLGSCEEKMTMYVRSSTISWVHKSPRERVTSADGECSVGWSQDNLCYKRPSPGPFFHSSPIAFWYFFLSFC